MPDKKKPANLGQRAKKQYLQAATETSSKLDLLIMVHDGALKAAHEEDAEQLKRLLDLLMKGLDFEKATLFAVGQLRLYKHCMLAADHGAFKEVIHILSQLRDAWVSLKASDKS